MNKAVVFLLLFSPVIAVALRCGGALIKPCLGETDIRYDPKASNALKDQALVYEISEGYFRCE